MLKTHTDKIGKINTKMDTCVTIKMFDKLVEKTQSFALNVELKELYEKIVPPAAEMETMAKEMNTEVQQLKTVVLEFDASLCTKANRLDLLSVDNKFRKYVKKDKFKDFVEVTELDASDLKAEVNGVVS